MKLTLRIGTEGSDAEAAIRRALALQASAGAVTEVHATSGGVVGVVGRPGQGRERMRVHRTAAGDLVLLAGSPIARGSTVSGALDGVLRRLAAGAPTSAVAEALTTLDGPFAAVLWHASDRRFAIVTDPLGMQPLYVRETPGEVVYSTDLRGIVAAGGREPEFDAAGWGAFFHIGHPIGDRTTLAGARRVPAACVRVLGEAGEVAEERTYWQWPTELALPLTEAADRIVDALREDVAAALREEPDTTLLFSGGFDSRLILALVVEAGASPRLLCHSHPDENANADARFAGMVARVYGLPMERVDADPGFFASPAYLRYLRDSEVTIPSLPLFIAQVSRLVTPELRAVWDGCLIGPLLKFSGGAAEMGAYLRGRVDARRRRFHAMAAGALHPGWLTAMDEGFDASVRAARERLEGDPRAPWRFQVESRTRMRTGMNPFQVYGTSVPALAPGLSRASWEAACSVDPEDRRSLRLAYAVFQRHFPEALRVPIASGRSIIKPPGAGLGTSARYHEQRARAMAVDLVRRPKVAATLGALGVRAAFAWEPSPFPAAAVRDAGLPVGILARAVSPDERGAEVVFFMEAWRRVMTGALDAWQSDAMVHGTRVA